jgi:PhnB protein
MAKPIPDGARSVTPYLKIRDAARAIEFYKKAFAATEVGRMTVPNTPVVMHAELAIGDSKVMLTEENAECGQKSPLSLGGTPVSVHLYVPDVDKTFAAAVAAGAKAEMPPMNMFWGDRFAKVTDPFGHEWTIATHVEDVPANEMGPRAEEAFKQFAAMKK